MKYLNSFNSVGALNNFYKGKDYKAPNVNMIKTSENEDPIVDMNSEYEIICFFDTTENLSGPQDLITNYDLTSLESIIVDGNRYRIKDLPLNKSELEPGEHIIKLKYKNKTTFGNLSNSSPVFMNAYLKKVIIPKGIETLHTNVFYFCEGLDYIKIPNTVKSISTNGIFANGSRIKTLDLSEMDPTLFNNSFLSHNGGTYIDELICPNNLETTVSSFGGLYVKKVNLGQSLTEIPAGCFASISNYIEEIIIPNTVTSIGGSAFSYCSKINNINLPSSLTTIGDSAFNGCTGLTSIIIPESVTSIGENAFNNCNNLTSINLPSSLITISNNTFYYCNNLRSITIPNSVTSIGNSAFHYCSNLEEVNISNNSSLTTIGDSAFNYCSKLTSIDIPNSVTSIGIAAFYETKITNINISNNLISIGSSAFNLNYNTRSNIYFDNSRINNLGNIINPSVIKNLEIGQHVITQNGELCLTTFGGFSNMESITFPDGLTVLPNLSVVSGFSSLKTFNIPSTITTIYNNCFWGCNSLEDSYVEDGIRYIDIDNFGTYIIDVIDLTLQHYTIKNGVKSLPFTFKSSYTNIESITLPNSLVNIEDNAFDYLYDNDILTSQQIDFILNINPNAISKIIQLMQNPTSYFEDKYFSICALESGTLNYSFFDSAVDENSNKYKVLEYSKDNGETWLSIDNVTGTESNSYSPTKTISVLKNDIILFRSTITPQMSEYLGLSYGIGNIKTNFNYYVTGNIMSLLYGDNFVNKTSLSNKNYAFYNLFDINITITNYENYQKLIRADKLILPATTLSKQCYRGMFNSQANLTTAPELPATTLNEGCYYEMFRNCSSLTIAPELPATTLAKECYSAMFNCCTSLTTTPELPATTLANNCYRSMFNGCSLLTTAPELPATTLADNCYVFMFRDCITLTAAPELPATTLAQYCYSYMFYGCTALTTAPELPATTLTNYCYENMFKGCTSLTTAPELLATQLKDSCYWGMFNGCTSLNYIKCLFTDWNGYTGLGGALHGWVSNVSSTGTFIKDPSMTTLPSGSSGIPSGWTVQDYVAS